jgi:hypothetical protein
MKWMLVVYICSGIAGECRTPPEYPAIKDTYYECVQDGLGDAYEILFGSDSIFTPEVILNSQLYPQYKCTPVKDEGKISYLRIILNLSARPKKGTNKQKV